ncbi:MAG: hypothetical protein ACXWJK_00600, partial [Burkholderiaceae bacterium]
FRREDIVKMAGNDGGAQVLRWLAEEGKLPSLVDKGFSLANVVDMARYPGATFTLQAVVDYHATWQPCLSPDELVSLVKVKSASGSLSWFLTYWPELERKAIHKQEAISVAKRTKGPRATFLTRHQVPAKEEIAVAKKGAQRRKIIGNMETAASASSSSSSAGNPPQSVSKSLLPVPQHEAPTSQASLTAAGSGVWLPNMFDSTFSAQPLPQQSDPATAWLHASANPGMKPTSGLPPFLGQQDDLASWLFGDDDLPPAVPAASVFTSNPALPQQPQGSPFEAQAPHLPFDFPFSFDFPLASVPPLAQPFEDMWIDPQPNPMEPVPQRDNSPSWLGWLAGGAPPQGSPFEAQAPQSSDDTGAKQAQLLMSAPDTSTSEGFASANMPQPPQTFATSSHTSKLLPPEQVGPITQSLQTSGEARTSGYPPFPRLPPVSRHTSQFKRVHAPSFLDVRRTAPFPTHKMPSTQQVLRESLKRTQMGTAVTRMNACLNEFFVNHQLDLQQVMNLFLNERPNDDGVHQLPPLLQQAMMKLMTTLKQKIRSMSTLKMCIDELVGNFMQANRSSWNSSVVEWHMLTENPLCGTGYYAMNLLAIGLKTAIAGAFKQETWNEDALMKKMTLHLQLWWEARGPAVGITTVKDAKIPGMYPPVARAWFTNIRNRTGASGIQGIVE